VIDTRQGLFGPAKSCLDLTHNFNVYGKMVSIKHPPPPLPPVTELTSGTHFDKEKTPSPKQYDPELSVTAVYEFPLPLVADVSVRIISSVIIDSASIVSALDKL